MDQAHADAVAHADMRPFPLAKPAIQLHADEKQECREASIADDGAESAYYAQRGGSNAHV
jgi:hypothetical protein